jgi:hypothetical protein
MASSFRDLKKTSFPEMDFLFLRSDLTKVPHFQDAKDMNDNQKVKKALKKTKREKDSNRGRWRTCLVLVLKSPPVSFVLCDKVITDKSDIVV